jgi:hypothetical protein
VPDKIYDTWLAQEPQNNIHACTALTGFFFVYLIHFVSTIWSCYLFLSTGELSQLTLGSSMWLIVAATRLFGCIVGVWCLVVFMTHLLKALGNKSHVPKSFWAEYTMIMIMVQNAILVAISSWFDFRSAAILHDFNARSIVMQYSIAAIALLHVYIFLKHYVSAAFLVGVGHVKYTDAQLVSAFGQWHAQESRNLAAFKKLQKMYLGAMDKKAE